MEYEEKLLCLILCMLIFAFALVSCVPDSNTDDGSGDGSGDGSSEGGGEGKQEAKEPQTVEELYAAINEKADSLVSYRIDTALDMTVFVEGYKMIGKSTGYIVRSSNLDGADYIYEESTIKTSCDELDLKTTEKDMEAYYEGKSFISRDAANGMTQRLYSTMSAEDALEYYDDSSLDSVDMLKDCTTKTFSKEEDGGWKLTCSGYTKVAVETFNEVLGLEDLITTSELIDVNVVILADSEYRTTEFKTDFVFKESSAMPVLSAVEVYSAYNEPVTANKFLNTNNFYEVSDVRALQNIQDLVDNLYSKDPGKFTLRITQYINSNTGTLYTQTETDTFTFGTDTTGYYYSIDADINGIKCNISYKSGVKTMTLDGQSQSESQTEKEARAYIEALINSSLYSPIIVTDVEQPSDTVYEFTCNNLDLDVYRPIYEQIDARLDSATQNIKFTLKDGEINKIFSNVVTKGYLYGYGNITLVVVTELTVKTPTH